MKPIGISLHIGLNRVDPAHYPEVWELAACEADADAMAELARQQGFEPQLLLSEAATRQAVCDAIRAISRQLSPGDYFLLTYAGHGGRVPDTTGDETDGRDETWCLYDAQLLDDELLALWTGFAEGVRILIISDSCHSGSVSQCIFEKYRLGDGEEDYRGFRYMPRSMEIGVWEQNKALYANIRESLPESRAEIKAAVNLLAACQDEQFAREVEGHGLFTACLLESVQAGECSSYEALYDQVRSEVNARQPDQWPAFRSLGQGTDAFAAEVPFQI